MKPVNTYLGLLVVLTLGSSALAESAGHAPARAGTQKEKDAGTGAEVKPDVVFNHLEGKSKIFDLNLNDGQVFVVRIDKTCPTSFDYSYVEVERGKAGITGQSEGDPRPPLSHKDITITYSKRFGGYTFSVIRKPSGAKPCVDDEKLGPASFIISVRQLEWNIGFSGGFTFSGLTDPVFSVKTAGAVKTIVEEPDKQDDRRLGAASFVHVFHDALMWRQLQPALAFGLGINGDNRAEYHVGVGLRLGDKATINVGRVWGSIARLPNGMSVGGLVTDDNVLNNLGSRVVSRWSFALSYSFIDTKDRLLKPFAEDPAASGGQGGAPAGANEAPSAALQKQVETAAADAKTYSSIAKLKALLDGTVKICRAEVTGAGKAEVNVLVHLQNATPENLKTLDTVVGTEAKAAINKALPSGLENAIQVKNPVTFDATCK